ncbi:MAG: hypothetical protein ACMXYE_02815 [Candidatus Woesearchaeota archaeon]
MMETFSNYPVRKIVIEFHDGNIFANGRKYKNIDELLQWVKECEKLQRQNLYFAIP